MPTESTGLINLHHRAGEGARFPVRMWRTHGFDPLTRPAPADEDAGCGPPSPPKGRGKKIRVPHPLSIHPCRRTNVETPGSCKQACGKELPQASSREGKRQRAARTPKLRSAGNDGASSGCRAEGPWPLVWARSGRPLGAQERSADLFGRSAAFCWQSGTNRRPSEQLLVVHGGRPQTFRTGLRQPAFRSWLSADLIESNGACILLVSCG